MPGNWRSPAFWPYWAGIAGLCTAAIGAFVIFGWLSDTAWLTSLNPEWVAMKANTAIGFVCAGVALWLKSRLSATASPVALWAIRALASLSFLIGALSLFEYLTDIDLGIDQLLVQEVPVAVGTLTPGRMAPASALLFIFVGIALQLNERMKRSSRMITVIALSIAFAALLSGFIFLYDTDNSYGIGHFMQLAVHTVLAFLLLAIGLLCLQPEQGMIALIRSPDIGGVLIRRLLPVAVIAPLAIGWLKLSGEKHQLYEPDFGVALVALAYVFILGSIVVWAARFRSRAEAEREHANAVVAVSEARLRALLRTIPDLVWMKDAEGVYLACNAPFERLFGARAADIIGKTDYDFVDKELADSFRANDLAAIAAGRPRANEEWLAFADTGQRILVETIKTPVLDEHGQLLGVLGIARDITARYEDGEALRAARTEAERLLAESEQSRRVLLSVLEDSRAATAALRQSEESLRASQARYVTLFGAIADAVYVHEVLEDGTPSRIFEVNEIACLMTGYSRDELLGMTPLQLDAPDSGTDLRPLIQRLKAGESVTFEQVHKRKDGQLIPVEIRAHLFRLNDSPAVIALVRDITERKRTENVLRDSEERYRTIIENSNDMIWTLSADGRFTFINHQAANITGRSIEDWLGETFVPLVQEEDLPMVLEMHRKIMGGEKVHYEVRGKKADGGMLVLSVNASPIIKDGKVIGTISFAGDITARKHAEEQLRKLNEELEHRVQERTAQLAASNKELEAFSYSVSHDLRAPLRSIAGFVELLRKHNYESIDDKGRHYLDVIAGSAVQMGRLIDDILTFSRIGRTEMIIAGVNLNEVLDEVRNTLRPQSHGRRVEWKVSDLPVVNGERNMLLLVLQNLISNALKFTQKRDVAVIEIGCAPGGQNETVCYVRDNGVGFDMRHVDKLFGLFQRLHAQNEFEGTGVGLANVQRIVQRHGGRVWAEGKVGEGATFYFALPKRES